MQGNTNRSGISDAIRPRRRTRATAGSPPPGAVMKARIRSGATAVGAGALALILAAPLAAQSRDFLFSRPRVTLAIRGGWAVPTAGSEIFDFTRDELTVDENDFEAF